MSNTHRDAIFYQAALPKRVWNMAIEVMDLFENAKLKGQKLNLSTLLTKPEFKQQYLAPIRRLNEHDQCTLLQEVINGGCSLADLKMKAGEIKQMNALQAAFLRLTNTETWEEAQEKYPLFASDAQLRKFLKVDLNKSVPQSFIDFCTRAKLSEAQSETPSGPVVKLGTSVGYVLSAKITELSGQTVKAIYPEFRGANLSIVTFDTV